MSTAQSGSGYVKVNDLVAFPGDPLQERPAVMGID
jgi:hypothetical protein